MKTLIYTVITGNYESLKRPLVIEDADYICFTDDPNLTDDFWNVEHISGTLSEPATLSRLLKINIQKYALYDRSVYLDANFQIQQPVLPVFDTPFDIAFFRHKTSVDCYTEIYNCYRYRRGNREILEKQYKDYKSEGIPTEKGQPEASIIWRNHTTVCLYFCESWFKEYMKYPSRDQPALYKILQNRTIKPLLLKSQQRDSMFFRYKHGPRKKSDIYYFKPFSTTKHYGEILNKHCSIVPHSDDWICIYDYDTLHLSSKQHAIIERAIERYPDTALFGCMTNRLGSGARPAQGNPQLYMNKCSDNDIMRYHMQIADDLAEKYNDGSCLDYKYNIAGMFMLFRKSYWLKHKFQPMIVNERGKFFDYEFCLHSMNNNLKIRIIQGVYLWHTYRLDKDKKDISHLR